MIQSSQPADSSSTSPTQTDTDKNHCPPRTRCEEGGGAVKWATWPVWVALLLAIGCSVWVLMRTLNLPLLDQHDFRQTQTAISAFWMTKNFSLFHYETPVLGMPWSIPFEFPLYQALVALLWKLFPNLSLDAAARLVSWGAWAACAYPIHRIMMRYFRNVTASGILLCLFFSSPFSVFWARTAMIETTALLCSLMFLWELIRLGDAPSRGPTIYASIWGILAMVVKVTTVPPFMLAGGLHILYMQRQRIFSAWKFVTPPFVLSVLSMVLWTYHADAVKSENSIGSFLASGSISWWNFGTLTQKLDPKIWSDLLQRNLHELYGSVWIFGASCLLVVWCRKRFLLYALYALLLFMVPMLLFTNLYAVHNYYQTANMIFMLAFTAILIYGAAKRLPGSVAYLPTLVLTLLFVLLFQGVYGYSLKYAGSSSAPPLVVGRMLNMLTDPDDRVAVFGDDWSSSTQYYAQRRGFSYPWWIQATDYPATLDSMPQRLGGNPAAVVVYIRPEPPAPLVQPGEEPVHLKWTKPRHLQAIEHTGTVFPALLAGMHKAQVADAIVYYRDRPGKTFSLLDAPVSGVSPQTTIRRENNALVVTAEHGDPFFSVPVTVQPDKHYLVRLRIQGPKGFAQLFYHTAAGGGYAEVNSVTLQSNGELSMIFPLPANATGPTFRLDPGNQPGEYIISDFSLLEVAEPQK